MRAVKGAPRRRISPGSRVRSIAVRAARNVRDRGLAPTGRGTSIGGMAGANGDTPRELFLIDGNSLAYRAFFALPESISTSDGRPTNAIFRFASLLAELLPSFRASPIVVVWDAGMS